MSSTVIPLPQKPARQKRAVPDHQPYEAPTLACSACGNILKPKVKMGSGWLEGVYYECVNEEYGCNYRYMRKVPVQFGDSMITIPKDEKKK